MAKALQLPAEAVELIGQVRSLQEHAREVSAELQADLAGIRKAAADERAAVLKEAADASAELDRQRDELERERAALAEQSRREADRLQAERQAVRESTAAGLASVERQRVAAAAELAREREALEALLHDRVRGFDFIADAWADYELARAERLADALEDKKHPAVSAAAEVRAKGQELAQLRRELKRAQWVLALYESTSRGWPSCATPKRSAYVAASPTPVTTQPTATDRPTRRGAGSPRRSTRRCTGERNQRALDRYLARASRRGSRPRLRALHRLPARAGRRNGHLPGHLRGPGRPRPRPRSPRRDGWYRGHAVQALGAAQDHPREARLPALRHRRRRPHRTPRRTVNGTFTTTTRLSERARQFATTRHPRRGARPARRLPAHQVQHRARRGSASTTCPSTSSTTDHHRARQRRALGRHRRRRRSRLGFRRAWRWKGAAAGTPS